MKKNGFTLIEMMVVLVILAIMIAIAVPSVKSLFGSRTIGDAAEDFIGAVRYSRQLAMSSNINVNLVATSGIVNGYEIIQNGVVIKSFQGINSQEVTVNYVEGVLVNTNFNVAFYSDGTTSLTGMNDIRFCSTNIRDQVGKVVIVNGSGFSSIGNTNQEITTSSNQYQKCN